MPATFLESDFPYRDLSLVISAERRGQDPAYRMHGWWARRPPALLRAVLIASTLDSQVDREGFWATFASDDRLLSGRKVFDPFAGGGSTLVEAARLGADVVGGDIDPLAVEITQAELTPPDPEAVRTTGQTLLDELGQSLGYLYPSVEGAVPLHYFHVPIVRCSHCKEPGPLYRKLVLVRDAGKPGAVVRDTAGTAFCPSCFGLQHLTKPDASDIKCCDTTWKLDVGTFSRFRYHCPHCGHKSSHSELSTGLAPWRLVAVEETVDGQRRRLRAPTKEDIGALDRANRELAEVGGSLHMPEGNIQVGNGDRRPLTFGIKKFRQLFTSRQLLVLGSAWRDLERLEVEASLARALRLALSNALTTNNRLCGYATDYGRLSGLFAVRGYSIPALPVELNPLHATAGRGTLAACIARVSRGGTVPVRRLTWSPIKQEAIPQMMHLTVRQATIDVQCRAADTDLSDEAPADLCVFDPPYYDYIRYDEMSAFHRAWLGNPQLAGPPLLPPNGDGREAFGNHLGRCFERIVEAVRGDRPVTFTFHSTNPLAWEAIGVAMDQAKLKCTAVWPVLSDSHMGHRGRPGNAEWDLLIVCRPSQHTTCIPLLQTVDEWVESVEPLVVGEADLDSMLLAIETLSSRFAAPENS
ncbi:MAG: DUF1156 domain-containing protein [Gemmatimonadetes bacterium]|nr:DUF1156 domain-containing protein [Gemmatimonadota bacterium]